MSDGQDTVKTHAHTFTYHLFHPQIHHWREGGGMGGSGKGGGGKTEGKTGFT